MPKGSWARKRAIIVGNGPSLHKTPLEKLQGATWGVNRINLIYPHTSWRPDYYVRVETINDDDPTDFWSDVHLHIDMGTYCFFPRWELMLGEHDHVHYFTHCHHYMFPAGHEKSPREWHLPQPCDFGTVVTTAMQLAVMEGFKEIYLVGCDLGYDSKTPHFYDSSQEKRRTAAETHASLMQAHENAKKSCPIPIYNATIGGDLEIYPRVDIEELF